jgi:hypothetical protein
LSSPPSRQIVPVRVSVNAPVARFSTPSSVSVPVAPASFPVPPEMAPEVLEAARERIYEHSLKLEDARAVAAYEQNSSVGKILEIHQELPGRIHVVLIRQAVGY